MKDCTHRNLLLLAPPKERIRCRRCHLTLRRDELRQPYCPECYEAHGVRQTDFEEVKESEMQRVQYRCEDCGVLIVVGE
ncbi:MAG: hypothetical protein R2911_00860 [Caldilineaceae bacterium]